MDGWDPSYGSSADGDLDLQASEADVTLDVEVPADDWAAVPAPPGDRVGPGAAGPGSVVFIDGVRRIEARVWIDEPTGDQPATDASIAICASYAAGAVCCCSAGAHLLHADVRRGLFAFAAHAEPIRTGAGVFHAHRVEASRQAPGAALSADLQTQLTALEVTVSQDVTAQLAEHGVDREMSLVVVDGPLRDRGGLRTLGFVKSHQRAHLPPAQHQLVSRLQAGQRTPVFSIGPDQFRRHSWYLRLPCLPGAPWAGIARVEAAGWLQASAAVALAEESQRVLPRFGSAEYKDSRAPQNLYPVAGLERELRRRLGESRIVYRALRIAAQR